MSIDLLELSGLQIFLAVCIIFFAYMVKGVSGFGSGLIAVPLLVFILPLTFVVPVLGLLSYSGTIMQSYQYRRQVVWRDILPLLPFTVLGILLAIWLLTTLNAKYLVMVLGGFIFCYAVYSLLPVPEWIGGRKWAIPGGFLGGLVGALFGTGGPFYVIYLKMCQLDKAQFRASIALVFLFDGGLRITGYALSGLYTESVLLMLLLLFPVLVLGLTCGHHLHIRMSQKSFNRIISVLLLVSGLMLVYKASSLE